MHKIASLPASKNWKLAIHKVTGAPNAWASGRRSADYEQATDLPVYLARLVFSSIYSDSTTYKTEFNGEEIEISFPPSSQSLFLKMVAAGRICIENGGFITRFTFARRGLSVFAVPYYPEEEENA